MTQTIRTSTYKRHFHYSWTFHNCISQKHPTKRTRFTLASPIIMHIHTHRIKSANVWHPPYTRGRRIFDGDENFSVFRPVHFRMYETDGWQWKNGRAVRIVQIRQTGWRFCFAKFRPWSRGFRGWGGCLRWAVGRMRIDGSLCWIFYCVSVKYENWDVIVRFEYNKKNIWFKFMRNLILF